MLVVTGMRGVGRYGFTKVSLLDRRVVEFVPVHDKSLRDIRCSPRPDGLVLTVSTDRLLRVVSTASNVVVQSYNLGSPGWACCWDASNPHRVFAGQQDGTIALYDMRHGAAPVHVLSGLGQRPLGIHSLDTWASPEGADPALASPLLLVGTLENAFAVPLGPEGPQADAVAAAPAMDGAGMCVCARACVYRHRHRVWGREGWGGVGG